MKFAGPRVPLARLGVRLFFDKRLDRFDFLGRGPMENYVDRKRGFDVGLYSTGVNEQYAYEKPMERANHEDVRWAALTGAGLPGLLAQADGDLLQVSALPHTDEQMTPVEYKIDLPPSEATVLCLSAKTLGVGSNGCGPRPLEKYIVWSKPARSPTSCGSCRPDRNRRPNSAGCRHRAARPAAAAARRRAASDRSRWRVVSCTSFEEGEGEPEHAIDGDPATFWHSRWSDQPTRNPHELVIDFGAVAEGRRGRSTGPARTWRTAGSRTTRSSSAPMARPGDRPAATGRFENHATRARGHVAAAGDRAVHEVRREERGERQHLRRDRRTGHCPRGVKHVAGRNITLRVRILG